MTNSQITIVTRWETTQMPAQVEWQMWRQLKGAFHINRVFATPIVSSMEGYGGLKQFSSMEDALSALDEGTRLCFLEPTGNHSIYDIPRDEDIALILGDSAMNNLAYASAGETYEIKAPSQVTHLYGVTAAGIALAIRYGQ